MRCENLELAKQRQQQQTNKKADKHALVYNSGLIKTCGELVWTHVSQLYIHFDTHIHIEYSANTRDGEKLRLTILYEIMYALWDHTMDWYDSCEGFIHCRAIFIAFRAWFDGKYHRKDKTKMYLHFGKIPQQFIFECDGMRNYLAWNCIRMSLNVAIVFSCCYQWNFFYSLKSMLWRLHKYSCVRCFVFVSFFLIIFSCRIL